MIPGLGMLVPNKIAAPAGLCWVERPLLAGSRSFRLETL